MPVYTIKPLTWQDVSMLNAESQHFRAKTACGDYDVWFSPIALKWEASGSERWQFDFDSADAAKAAAESWYRERLATALTPSPLAEAAREAREILEQVVDYFSSDCRFDHHDQCQAHALQSRGDCFVALAKDLLESQALEGAPSCK
jgi:hypothetical protein